MKFDAVKDFLIAEANRAGLSEYEVYFMESSGLSAETLKDEISSFSSAVSGGIGFRCVVDGHMGSASTSLLSAEEMTALVARAIENAKTIESQDKAIIFGGSETYAECKKPESKAMSAAEIKALALKLQKQTYAQSELIADGTQSGVSCMTHRYELINSKGLELSNDICAFGAYTGAVVQKDGESRDAYAVTMEMTEEKLAELPEKAVNEALAKLG